MTKTTRKIAAIIALVGMSQTACYNSYFISKSELEKLEASVEPEEVVEVYGDCPSSNVASLANAQMWAQAPEAEPAPEAPAEPADPAGEGEAASDAPAAEATPEAAPEVAEAPAAVDAPAVAAEAGPTNTDGCTKVNVQAGNALYIVDTSDERSRVTPFNFIMSAGQLVSPEYDVLKNLDDVRGAEVREFSTWKTVGTIVGVSAVAVGTFIAITVLAPDASGFQGQ